MKKVFIVLLANVFWFLPTSFTAKKVFEYGFEDWGGSIAETPRYPFSSHYSEFCDAHAESTEVVSSYKEVLPHSGNYFFLMNHGPGMDPMPEGITTWHANTYNWLGIGPGHSSESNCGGENWDVESITTGECFLRFYVVNSEWDAVKTNHDAKLKFIRYYEADDVDVMWMVYQNVADNREPQFGIDAVGSPYYTGTIDNWDDGNWHRVSMYVNYNTGQTAIWFDVKNESLENATLAHNYGPGGIEGAPTPSPLKLIGNWSANNPTENVWHAIDDIEVWDGIPLIADVSGNGSVDINDVQACVNHILGRQNWGSAADVNGDEEVNVLDVQEIVNIVLG